MLKTDPKTGTARIKLYETAEGIHKGDALVSFLKPESVSLAVTLRDGFEMRPGQSISVQPAKFEKRNGADGGAGAGGGGGGGGGRQGKEEAQVRKKQRLLEQRALAEWDTGLSSGKRNSTVVLTGLFDAAAVTAEAQAEGDGAAGEAAFLTTKRN